MKVKDFQGVVSEEMIQGFVQKGLWKPGEMFWMWWDEHARKTPDKVALVDAKNTLTWKQAREWGVQIALGFLEMGMGKDDVVVSMLPNCAETVCLRDGLERAGIINFTLATGFRQREMNDLIGRSKAVAIVIPGLDRFEEHFDFTAMIQEIKPGLPSLKRIITVGKAPEGCISLADVMAKGKAKQVPDDYFKKTTMGFDELVTLRATSGSTGLPKICTNTTPLHNAQDYADRWHVTGDDVILAIATVATGAGLPAVELNGLTGCKAVLVERWDPKAGPERVLSTIQQEKITIACGVPPHVLMTANHPNFDKFDTSSLRIFTWAGAPLAKEQIDRLEKKLGAKLLSFYGMMDTGWISAVAYDDSIETRCSSVGKAGTKRELKIIDENGKEVPKGDVGEILVRGAIGNLGYFKDAERAKEVYDAEAWYHTRDLGRLDAADNIQLMGRATDTINRGGQKIFPLEIENILRSHPKVAEVAVIPMPDPILGQRPCAYVELKPGVTEFTFDEMTARMEQMQMAKYNRPERLELMEKLPRTPSQKVDKQILIADIKQKLGA